MLNTSFTARILKSTDMYGYFGIAYTYSCRKTYEEILGNKNQDVIIIPFSEFVEFAIKELSNETILRTFLIPDDTHRIQLLTIVLPMLNAIRYNIPIQCTQSEMKIFNKLYINFLENCIVLQQRIAEFTRESTVPAKDTKQIPIILPTLGAFKKIINLKQLEPVTSDILEEVNYKLIDQFNDNTNVICGELSLKELDDLNLYLEQNNSFIEEAYCSSTIYGVNLPLSELTSAEMRTLKNLDRETEEFRKQIQSLGAIPDYEDVIPNKPGEETSRNIRFKTYPKHVYNEMLSLLNTDEITQRQQSLKTADNLLSAILILRSLLIEINIGNNFLFVLGIQHKLTLNDEIFDDTEYYEKLLNTKEINDLSLKVNLDLISTKN